MQCSTIPAHIMGGSAVPFFLSLLDHVPREKKHAAWYLLHVHVVSGPNVTVIFSVFPSSTLFHITLIQHNLWQGLCLNLPFPGCLSVFHTTMCFMWYADNFAVEMLAHAAGTKPGFPSSCIQGYSLHCALSLFLSLSPLSIYLSFSPPLSPYLPHLSLTFPSSLSIFLFRKFKHVEDRLFEITVGGYRRHLLVMCIVLVGCLRMLFVFFL